MFLLPYRIRRICSSILGQMVFYFLVIAYVMLNSSLFNVVLLSLLVVDVLKLQSVHDMLKKNPYKRVAPCSKEITSDPQSKRILLVSTDESEDECDVDKKSHSLPISFAFFPSMIVRKLSLVYFSLALLAKLFFAVLPRSWLENAPLLLRMIIYWINGGMSRIHSVLFEYFLVALIVLYIYVVVASRLYSRSQRLL